MPDNEDRAAEFARRSIEATLGVPVEHWDIEGRQGARDLRYVDPFGRSVAVEVKLIVDPEHRALLDVAGRAGYTQDARLHFSWHADIEWGKRFNTAVRALPDLLVELERIQWPGGGDWWRLRRVNPALAQQIEELGINTAFPSEATEKHPPGFYLMPNGWGGSVPSVKKLRSSSRAYWCLHEWRSFGHNSRRRRRTSATRSWWWVGRR